jgi:hypothetical protein
MVTGSLAVDRFRVAAELLTGPPAIDHVPPGNSFPARGKLVCGRRVKGSTMGMWDTMGDDFVSHPVITAKNAVNLLARGNNGTDRVKSNE